MAAMRDTTCGLCEDSQCSRDMRCLVGNGLTILARTAVVGVVAFAMTGCSAGNPPATPTSSAAAPGAGATSGALSLEQRVVPGDLAGVSSPAGFKSATTPAAYVDLQIDPTDADYAQQQASDIALLRGKGFVTGAVKVYGDDNSPGNGVSAVVQLGSPEQAKAYEQALYQDEFGTNLPPAAVKGTIDGTSASNTITDKGTQDGDTTSRGWAAFADGPFVYLEDIDSDAPGADPQAVLNAAKVLFTKVRGTHAP